MDINKAIKEFLEFEPKLLGDAADKIVAAINVFQESERMRGSGGRSTKHN